MKPSLDSLLTNGVGELHWMQPLDPTSEEMPEDLEERYEDDYESSSDEEDT